MNESWRPAPVWYPLQIHRGEYFEDALASSFRKSHQVMNVIRKISFISYHYHESKIEKTGTKKTTHMNKNNEALYTYSLLATHK